MAPFSTNDSSLTNSTFVTSSDGGLGPSSTLSGLTIFWAMLAIILNAMGQDSPTARAIFDSGDMENGLLMPYLSSPIFCLSDIVVDCYQIVSVWWKPTDADPGGASGGPSRATASLSATISVRAILFVFGVLPQAVRLYGVSGISWIQALATVYLATALLRLLRTIVVPAASTSHDPTLKLSQKETAQAAVIVVHLAAYLWLWNGIAKADIFSIDGSTPGFQKVHNMLDWMGVISMLVAMLITMVWSANFLFNFNRRLLYFPTGLLFIGAQIICCIKYYLEIQSGDLTTTSMYVTGGIPPVLIRIIPVFGMAVVSSFICATLLTQLSKRLLRSKNPASCEPENSSTLSAQVQGDGIPLDPVSVIGSPETDISTILPDARIFSDRSPTASQPTSSRAGPSLPSGTATESVDHCGTIHFNSMLSLSVLFELSFFWHAERGDRIEPPNLAWPSDSVLKASMTGWAVRGSMSVLPRAIAQVFRPSISKSGSSNAGLRGRVKDGLIHLFVMIVNLTITWSIFWGLVVNVCFVGMQILGRFWTPFKHILNGPLTFVILNLITAGLWYGQVWTGSGTVVPIWESWLG